MRATSPPSFSVARCRQQYFEAKTECTTRVEPFVPMTERFIREEQRRLFVHACVCVFVFEGDAMVYVVGLAAPRTFLFPLV